MVYVVNLLNDPGYDLTYDLALMLVRLWLLASCSCVVYVYVYAIATKWCGWRVGGYSVPSCVLIRGRD